MGLDPRLRVAASSIFSAASAGRLAARGSLLAVVPIPIGLGFTIADVILRQKTGRSLLETLIIPKKVPDTGVGRPVSAFLKDIVDFLNFGSIR